MQKRLFLIFHGRFPSEKAAALFAAKSAESFALTGLSVTLLVPRRRRVSKQDPFSFFSSKKNFNVVYLPTIDFVGVPVITEVFFPISYFFFSLSLLVYLLVHAKRDDILYSNESFPLLLSAFFFKKIIYEMHDFPEGHFSYYRFFLKLVSKIITTNNWKKEKLISQFSVPRDKIFVELNAVDMKEFDIAVSKEDARKRLNLPQDAFIILYTGHLYSWKGVDTLAHSTEYLPADFLIVFVGGTETDVAAFKKKYAANPKIFIVGFRPHKEIPIWQKAADVLVLPNTEKQNISKYYTSPMKLFEYMASGRPIVASRLPSVLEIVDDTKTILVSPDDEKALAESIKKVAEDPALAEACVQASFEAVKRHTWEARAGRILSFIVMR
jgi:glycosyltransferase involved in cell wall biosynthesis